jgi:hypothetical protein
LANTLRPYTAGFNAEMPELVNTGATHMFGYDPASKTYTSPNNQYEILPLSNYWNVIMLVRENGRTKAVCNSVDFMGTEFDHQPDIVAAFVVKIDNGTHVFMAAW